MSFKAILRINKPGFASYSRCSTLSLNNIRCISTAQVLSKGGKPAIKDDGWFQKLLPVRSIDPGHESHSTRLANKDIVYELQMHAVKPECMDQYKDEYEKFVHLVKEKGLDSEHVGSFNVEVGDQDEAIHLWKYPGGYPILNHTGNIHRSDQDFIDIIKSRNKLLRYRNNQILLAFNFWGDIAQRDGKNIYELRSYTLKPGTMIEWGNNWARGIKSRVEQKEAVAGFFSQIGELSTVQHLWAYDDLESRKKVRAAAWATPGWDDCVAYTVPLIRSMKTRILLPMPFSPLQ